MKRILHVKTRREDDLAEAVCRADVAAGAKVTCIDLTAAEVDYQKLLEAIFQAEVVESW